MSYREVVALWLTLLVLFITERSCCCVRMTKQVSSQGVTTVIYCKYLTDGWRMFPVNPYFHVALLCFLITIEGNVLLFIVVVSNNY